MTKDFLDSFKTDNPTDQNLSPEKMIDQTFLMPPGEDGSRARARIIRIVNDLKNHLNINNHPELIKFQCLLDGEKEEVVVYNNIVNYIMLETQTLLVRCLCRSLAVATLLY